MRAHIRVRISGELHLHFCIFSISNVAFPGKGGVATVSYFTETNTLKLIKHIKKYHQKR